MQSDLCSNALQFHTEPDVDLILDLIASPSFHAASPTVAVVVPTLDEESNIAWVLERIPPWVDEVVLVDGGSKDHTVDVARACRPSIRVTGQERPGKGAALRAGFAACRSDVIVMIDADGSMDPGEISRYVDMMDAGGYDLVKGSRSAPGGASTDITPVRRLGNRCLTELVNTLFGAHFSELCYGFMALRRESLQAFALTADGFEIETQIVVNALRARLKVAEVPSHEAERRNGQSHLHAARDGLRVLRTILRTRLRSQPRLELKGAAA